MSHPDTDLFSPVTVGRYTLSNRVVMAPLTRSRAGAGDVPQAMTAAYYAQRASAGLLIAEATAISPQAKGYAFTPGIYSPAQVEGWRKVTDAVHAKGGHIFLQIWHVGRISHPDLQPGGTLPVAPSAVRPENSQAFTETGLQAIPTPRALDTDEIAGIVGDFAQAAKNAVEAGFDGVEIHAANGYLLTQFLHDSVNRRTDAYGGSIPNRARIVVEIVAAVTKAIGADRVGIRISPLSTFNETQDSNPEALYAYLVEELNRFDLAYLHVIEGQTGGERAVAGGFDLSLLRRLYTGTYMANNGYSLDLAIEARRTGAADLVAFGRPFIANPDLVERLRTGAALNTPDQNTFYGGGEQGYLDYPTLAKAV